MQMIRLEQWGGAVSGLAAALLLIAGTIVSDINELVPVTASSSTIASTFVAQRTNLLIGTYLSLLGVFFLVCFLGYLKLFLQQAAGESSWLVTVAFGGGLVACAMLLLAAHFSQAFTVLPTYSEETQVAKALYVLEWNSYLLVEAPALAALVMATAAIGFTRKVLPWWLTAWGGLLTFILLSPVLPGSGVTLTFLWLGVLSIWLLRRSEKLS